MLKTIKGLENYEFGRKQLYNRFSVKPYNRRIPIWREPDTWYNSTFVDECFRFGGGGLMIWAGNPISGRTDLCIIRNGAWICDIGIRYSNLLWCFTLQQSRINYFSGIITPAHFVHIYWAIPLEGMLPTLHQRNISSSAVIYKIVIYPNFSEVLFEGW